MSAVAKKDALDEPRVRKAIKRTNEACFGDASAQHCLHCCKQAEPGCKRAEALCPQVGRARAQVVMYPSKSDGMFVPESLIFRSDSNGARARARAPLPACEAGGCGTPWRCVLLQVMTPPLGSSKQGERCCAAPWMLPGQRCPARSPGTPGSDAAAAGGGRRGPGGVCGRRPVRLHHHGRDGTAQGRLRGRPARLPVAAPMHAGRCARACCACCHSVAGTARWPACRRRQPVLFVPTDSARNARDKVRTRRSERL